MNGFTNQPNMLARYASGQQLAQQQRQSEQAENLKNAGMLAAAAYSVSTPEEFERAKGLLAQSGVVPAEALSQYTFDALPQLKDMARGIEGQISDERDRRNYETGVSQWERDFGYRKETNDRSFDYKKGRDQVGDVQWLEAWKAKLAQQEANANKPADEYGRYKAEQEAAGQPVLSRIDYAKAKQKKSSISVGADGTVRVTEGGVDEGRISPSSPDAMISAIDGILSDPALETSTGMLSVLQNVPGTGAKRFGTRARQLEGQAFLQAFESLKGAGQITEIEGAKATQAIGRLDTSQSAEDYRDALTELRDTLIAARGRPKGWAQQQQQTQTGGITPEQQQQLESLSPADAAALLKQLGY